jgi:predicted RNase H-like HicB family nuclease
MGLPYEIVIKHDEDGWFARILDLPGCMTSAETFEEVGPLIEDAMRGYIEVSPEHGDPIQEPGRQARE